MKLLAFFLGLGRHGRIAEELGENDAVHEEGGCKGCENDGVLSLLECREDASSGPQPVQGACDEWQLSRRAVTECRDDLWELEMIEREREKGS